MKISGRAHFSKWAQVGTQLMDMQVEYAPLLLTGEHGLEALPQLSLFGFSQKCVLDALQAELGKLRLSQLEGLGCNGILPRHVGAEHAAVVCAEHHRMTCKHGPQSNFAG